MVKNKNYIAVIGISDFGRIIKKRLFDDHSKSETDFLCDYFDILSQDDIKQLVDNSSKYELAMIIADLDDKNSNDLVSESLNLFDNKFVLGFFHHYKNRFKFDNKFTSIINLTDLNPYEAFCAVKLIPDLLIIPTIQAVFINDLKNILASSKIFESKTIEFSNDQIDNNLLKDLDLSESKSLIFCIYGNNDFEMESFDLIKKQISNKAKKDSLNFSNIIMTNYKYTKNWLVILYGVDNVVDIENINY